MKKQMENNLYLDRYFLNHGAGMFPAQKQAMADALAEFSADWCRPDNWDLCLAKRQQFLEHWAEELGTSAQNLCTMENVTTAVASLIGALPQTALNGRTVLIAKDCFPSLHFLLSGLQERHGFKLKTVSDPGSPYVRDDIFIDAWDEEAGLALLTWVSSTSSHRVNLDRMAAHARKMGSLTCADITQGAAIVPLDIKKANVDFAITTSLKWACGSPGAGAFYVRPDRLNECSPELRGWFSQDDPFRWDLDKFQFAADAGRFQNGTPAVLACYASIPGFIWRTKTGREKILNHNRKLTEIIRDHAGSNGWNVITPASVEERGASTMIAMPGQTDIEKLMTTLSNDSFTVDHRGRILRLSPGYTTTETAVADLCAILAEFL